MFSHLRSAASRRALAGLPLSIATVLLLGAPSRAADDAPPLVQLRPIVVSATRLPTPETELGSSVTVVTAADIERKQARTLADVLRDVPGLNLVQAGGPGGAASLFMRGTNANHTKVLIDGIDAADPSSATGAFDFSQILASDIARVEILRGPQSGLYGSDAIGGVVNIVTRKGSGPARLRGSIEGGSFGTFNQTAGASGSASRFNYDFGIAHLHSGDTPVTPASLVPPGRPVNADANDNKTFSTRLGADLAENFDVGLVARYVDAALRSTSDDFLGPEAIPTGSSNRALFTRGTAHLALFDGTFDQTAGIGYTLYRRRISDPNFVPADTSAYRGERVKLDWQGNVALTRGQILTLGAEHQTDEISDTSPVAARMTGNAGFVQLQSRFGERLFDSLSLRYDDNDRFGGRATWRVAPALLLSETGTRLKASLGTGFKAPTLDELFESFPAFGFFANPDLRPEKSLGYDLGVEQSALDGRLRLGATYFHNRIEDLIAVNDGGTSYENIGRATTWGVESFVAWQPWERLSLRADHTYTIAEDDRRHAALLRRPKHKASLAATWQATDSAALTATLLYVGPWIDANRAGTATGVTASGYALVNLAGAYDLGRGITAFARIDNLLDRQYQDPLGFRRPGLGLFAGLRVAFDAAAAP